MSIYDWRAAIERVRAENISAGRCPDCGGSGVVANMRKIEQTGDPHANRKCYTCRGTGRPKAAAEAP